MTKKTADGRLLTEVSIVEMEAGDINIGNVDIGTMPPVTVSGLTYLGEQSITMDGTSKAATLPAGTNLVMISAEDGPVRYTINAAATANSGGYVPQDFTGYVMKLTNLTSLALFGAASAKAHLIYYQEP